MNESSFILGLSFLLYKDFISRKLAVTHLPVKVGVCLTAFFKSLVNILTEFKLVSFKTLFTLVVSAKVTCPTFDITLSIST